MSVEVAREGMENGRKYYNELRPHGAIGQKVAIALLNRAGASSPPLRRSRKIYLPTIQSLGAEHRQQATTSNCLKEGSLVNFPDVIQGNLKNADAGRCASFLTCAVVTLLIGCTEAESAAAERNAPTLSRAKRPFSFDRLRLRHERDRRDPPNSDDQRRRRLPGNLKNFRR